ncbi:MAG: hypothetical protein F6J89_12000 [Symploca sp. SIO1C4]|uniref:Uncharacterized protein n=1 Tax=Symploca sp. SIO1C4 TaxID=2607765 RepID=A0A6B3NGB7_9CYAN|nr:hypothetical protein [Symploca sp. SIO1C4]
MIKLWEQRYSPELFLKYSLRDPMICTELLRASSPAGRALTASKLRHNIINLRCELAGIKAISLYSYIPNIVNLLEAKQLTKSSYQIYLKILEVYQKQAPPAALIEEKLSTLACGLMVNYKGALGKFKVEELAEVLEPLLLEFQQQHQDAKDRRTLGFLTTQLNFANSLLLNKLTSLEKMLIYPYFKFVEEQAALPWQRVCAAAARHEIGSPSLILVEEMLPVSNLIAQIVYSQLVKKLPNYHSCRGSLRDVEVAHSINRDLNMWLSYLWLCILEESLTPFKEELLILCLMVLTSVGVKWELISTWIKLLSAEVLSRATPNQRLIIEPYLTGIERLFFEKRMHLDADL